jgi:hypothetical protein
MRGMAKWLCEAYLGAVGIYLQIHSWSLSWNFALRAALWIFIGGSGVLTLFAELLRRASVPRPAAEYLGRDGEVRMPLPVKVLQWSAYGVLLVGSALILVEVFSKP